MVEPRRQLLVPLLVVLTASGAAWGWAEQDKVLLRDIQALTLYQGQYTNYRRTSPILQLQCTGGTAGCAAYKPDVVQCYNRGWDGYDVQWECKADLENSRRFGKIEVSCEGYDYPDDPYILKGSCGLQYTLELTKGGQQKTNYFGGYYHSTTSHDSLSSGAGVVLIIIFVFLVYGVYKLFLCDNRPQHGFAYGDGYSGTYGQDHQRPPPPGFNTGTYGQDNRSPPPPGFKSNFAGATGSSSYGSNSGPGFWTGLGAGGLLGYLFGNQRQPNPEPVPAGWTANEPFSTQENTFGSNSRMANWSPSYYPHSPYYNTWANSSYPPPSSSDSTSSGTRSTSGFGGTKRR